MALQKIALLLLVCAAMLLAWKVQQWLGKRIPGQRSFPHFLLLILLNALAILIIVVLTGTILIRFKYFFFTQ